MVNNRQETTGREFKEHAKVSKLQASNSAGRYVIMQVNTSN